MQNFQQILTEAAQLKQHQLKKDRKGYQSLPDFLKSGLGYNRKYEIVRKQHFHFQFRISNRVKQQGNQLFRQTKYEEALSRYEESLAIFRYIQSTSYQNMKDEHLSYHSFDTSLIENALKQKIELHLIALYLNISSCLTKLNKKQDAIFSADQALKIRRTGKGHYRKAQAYLKYVNRDSNDIKLGILELKQAYSIEKSEEILGEMHAAKQNYLKEQQKSKEWFKFMFDKNEKEGKTKRHSEQNPEKDQTGAQNKKVERHIKEKQKQKEVEKEALIEKKVEHLQKIRQMEENRIKRDSAEDEKKKFQQTKEKLEQYVSLPQEIWELAYEFDFIKRNGSKIYSILKIYKYDQLAQEYKSVLAKCLEKQEEDEQNKMLDRRKAKNRQLISWLRNHPMQKIFKYIQRYDLQKRWIESRRMQEAKKASLKAEEMQQKDEKGGVHRQRIPDKETENQTKAEPIQKRVQEKEKIRKYTVVGIILLLILLRFFWK